jgi:diguanylate cyclase (GGDEF)-like protein
MAVDRHPGRRQELVWLLTGLLALAAVVIITVLLLSVRKPAGEWPLGLVFLAAFIGAGTLALKFETRQGDTFVVTFAEIPFLLSLFYLPPLTVVLARLIALVAVQGIRQRRRPLVKFAFNTASYMAATAVACAIVYPQGDLDGTSPQTWLLLTAAVMTGIFVTAAAVAGAIAFANGMIPRQELVRTIVPAFAVALVNVMVALVVLIALQQSPWALVLIVGLAGFVVIAYRSYVDSVRQHRTLTEIYELTRAVSDTPHDGTLADVLLRRVQAFFHCEYATLWLPPQSRYPEVLLSARGNARGLVDLAGTPDVVRRRVLETGETIAISAVTGDETLRAALRQMGTKDAIAVPLRAGSAVIGCLEVAGRLGDSHALGESDVRLLEAIAAHAAVAVENNRLVDRLRHDAHHDSLTGLPNRRRISAALEEAVAVHAPGEVVAVLLFDVDGLRQVNETLGHAAGDKVLVEVARRLRQHAPNSALVGRIGGDEFVVTLRAEDAEAALDLAAHLREQIRDQMIFGSLTLDVDTAAGVAVHPDHGSDPATLLQRGDLAVTAAKATPGSIQLFSAGLESRSVRRLGLAADLRRALEQDELDVYFQPKMTLRDRRLVGVECLARWEHPAHGSVAPADFVAVAEHTGQLGRLTEKVIREGLRRSREWSAEEPLPVSVNLSARTLADPGFPRQVHDLLVEYGVPPERLTFEINESGVLDGTERPLPGLRRLRDLGVRLSVDDFGTGYSSLSFLRRLPVHEVKVDRTFVQGMATDPGDLAIVNAVVTLAQQFGLAVVAEGVESELTLELLLDIGCQMGQGFLFSRPLPYERLAAWYTAQADADQADAESEPGDIRRLRAVP